MHPKVRGFTITEVMVALVLVAIAVFALISAQVYASKAQRVNKKQHTAATLASSEIQVAERALFHDFGESVTKTKAPIAGYPDFEAEVTESIENPSGTLKRVQTTVYWTEQGVQREYTLWVLVHDRDA